MKKIIICLLLASSTSFAADLTTQAEKSNWKQTGRAEETQRLCLSFQKHFPKKVKCHIYGKTPENRSLYYMTVGDTKTPAVWVQAGIHAGEIDGKDAVFLLMKEILEGKIKNPLQGIHLVFIPIVNLDGHERMGKWNRPNQVGPEEMGMVTKKKVAKKVTKKKVAKKVAKKVTKSVKKSVTKGTLNPGDSAPDFSLPDQNGKTISLKDFRGQKVVVYFYPKALTPGCTTQACSISDAKSDLKKHNIVVLGISADPVKKLKQFEEKYKLNFELLSDETKKTIEAYGCWGLKQFMGREFMGILRQSFLLDEKGKVLHVMDKVNTKTHLDDVLKLFKNL